MDKSIFDTLSSSIYPDLLGQGIPKKKIISSVVGRLSKTGTDTQRLPGLFFEFETMVLKLKEVISDITMVFK
jgi:hypothetical protein